MVLITIGLNATTVLKLEEMLRLQLKGILEEINEEPSISEEEDDEKVNNSIS